jgi:hypothetical protein
VSQKTLIYSDEREKKPLIILDPKRSVEINPSNLSTKIAVTKPLNGMDTSKSQVFGMRHKGDTAIESYGFHQP